MIKTKRGVRILALLCILTVFAALFALGLQREKQRELPLSQRIPNNEEIVLAIRKGLREHSRQLTVSFSYSKDVLDELTALTSDWVAEALQETDDPAEGDYIRYQYGGYDSTCLQL